MNTCFHSTVPAPASLPAVGTLGDYVMPPIVTSDGVTHAPGFRVACRVSAHIGAFGLQLEEIDRPAFAIECHFSSFEAKPAPVAICHSYERILWRADGGMTVMPCYSTLYFKADPEAPWRTSTCVEIYDIPPATTVNELCRAIEKAGFDFFAKSYRCRFADLPFIML